MQVLSARAVTSPTTVGRSEFTLGLRQPPPADLGLAERTPWGGPAFPIATGALLR